MDKKAVSRELREQFFPCLTNAGFKRNGDIARRELPGGVVHVVEIQHRARGHVFQVKLGAHLLALGDIAGGELPAPQAFRDFDCAWRGSIISGFRNDSDAEFAYGATEQDATESVAFLVSEWPRQSDAFFAPFAAYPRTFHNAARAVAANAELHHPAHLLTWARVAHILGDSLLERCIAEVALPRVPERAVSLRENLQAIIER
ncbi:MULTISPECIES: DUF4304 domain-containing protein [Ralstonia]|uniref:DUF4304 domain-containing protein n=1 Tax=Ralstonia TaxID=48736 RepID=UPI000385C0BA|nr:MULTISPECIES: DUF4304 domain-containing protein [Ralstonia]EPX96714.1 hypothetical protein C404_17035 [Ralstonia sp. AU12-08]MBY4706635.1 DUF4304 domain-containing protein [Ralstonia insidiosa]GAQ27682.1 hypothetical protein SAMD00023378_1365 [Ralstonia sp. NT80]